MVENYLVSDLIKGNFKVCYEQDYATPTTSAGLHVCHGAEAYFVGAIHNEHPYIIAVGAFGSPAIFTANAAYYDRYGAYWYNYPGYGFGFSASNNVVLKHCDENSRDCGLRLCWNLDNGKGGEKAGCTHNLEKSHSWKKIIFRQSS